MPTHSVSQQVRSAFLHGIETAAGSMSALLTPLACAAVSFISLCAHRDPTWQHWRNREKREQYERAVREMIARTHTPSAPWTVIASNSKHHARITAQRAVIDYVNDLI